MFFFLLKKSSFNEKDKNWNKLRLSMVNINN